MFPGLARLSVVIVFVIVTQQVIAHNDKHKHGGKRNEKKTTIVVPKNRTAKSSNKFGKNAKQFSGKRFDKTRKSRGISLAALAGLDRAGLGISPLAVPYGTRLATLGYQQVPTLQQISQYRGLVPTTNGLLQNAAALRLPYGLQLARLLPALNLYRNQLQLAGNEGGNMATDVHVFKRPHRLKYDSIPLKPNVDQQELMGNSLNLPALLQLNSAGDQSISDLSDDNEADLDELGGVCMPNPCHNGGSCVNLGGSFECICRKGYRGKSCQERNPCLPNPCHNEGQCTVSGTNFECSCSIGWKGDRCEEPNKCHPNPCKNGGSCTELEFDYECTCPHGFHGKSCEEKKESCSQSPCLNDGRCIETSSGNYECICKPGFSGPTCAGTHNKCLQNPCQNAGTCVESVGGDGYECRCPTGFKGINCEERSPCQADTCQHGGTCFETESGFKCLCQEGYSGKTCTVRHSCQPNVCRNGAKCIEHDSGFKCICPAGYKGSFCDETDHCRPNPCQHGGDCIETENGFKCHCQAQYQGSRCEDLNMCVPNPCKNGGQCLGYEGGYKCLCVAGFTGQNCDDKNPCEPNPCHNGAACLKEGDHFKCSCRRGYTGEQCKMVDSCLSNPCQHGGTCKSEEGGFVCTCPAIYRGILCNEREPCHPNPCHNGGKCLSTSEGFVCRCATGYRGETCTEEDECEPNPCQNGGRCLAHYFGGGFDCECPLGFRGPSCQDKDPCRPNPCSHGGFCTEIGGGFACNCTLGFKGATCQEIDQCHPNPCQHGGFCREVVGGTGFACQCITGYKGARCYEKDRCHPNPCMHDGMCMEVNDELGFLCNCTSGYRGSHCQDLDPCRPNPCLNSGACLHTDDGYICNCSTRFKGRHCQERDLCKPNPCQFGNKCHQTGIDSYQCVKNLCNPSPCMHNGRCIEINDEDYTCACTPGHTGKNCDELEMCQLNPCMNGGTCSRTMFGGYKCDCIPGYSGINCTDFGMQVNAEGRHNVPVSKSTSPTDNLKAATLTSSSKEMALQVQDKPSKDVCTPNPCKNSGLCFKSGDTFRCKCSKGFKGRHCQINNPCIPNPCNNGGTCLLGEEGNFACRCPTTFAGATCQEATKAQRLGIKPHIDFCSPNPCKNNGVCVVEEGKGYSCACHPGFTGFHCQDDHCIPNPCHNQGLCFRDKARRYRCNCHNGFLGRNCEINSCLPNPCKNGGLCVTVRGKGYQCKCRDGFNGPHCESNPCYPNPCNNGGTCLVFYTVYLCKCPRAYRGTRCNVLIPEQALAPAPPPVTSSNFISEAVPVRKTTEHLKVNPCTSNPCLNSAVCLETIDDNFECFCRGDFSGPRCEDAGAYTYSSAPKFFPGKGEECQHCDRNAHCVGGHCICKHGFVGDGLDCWVETQRDNVWGCLPSPCQNGGTCKPGISKCVCRLGYVGDYCESFCPPSIHLSFDKYTQSTLQDDSGSDNNGLLANGAQIVPHGGKCGNAANLLGGDVLLDGAHFDKVPREGITIATWIKLDTNKGIQSIFDTVGSHSRHKDGQYHFEIENGKVRWFHRNENHDTIFSLLTRPIVREGVWTQLTATYNAKKQRARVFVNGDLREEVRGHGLLSLDWGGKAGIGRHKHQFGNRLLRGMIDEFYIFPCELPRLEILVLLRHCRVYFKNTKKVTEESSKTRGFASIMTPPISGQRNNQAKLIPPPRPAVSQVISAVAPAYQKQPATSTDYVANNLQQILASLTSEDRLGPHASSMYSPPQGYISPSQHNQPPLAYAPTPYPIPKAPVGYTNELPHLWSPNVWTNRQPVAVATVSSEASLRHNTPVAKQQMEAHEQPSVVKPAVVQTSFTQQINRNRQTGMFARPSLQASLRNGAPLRMQQGNTAGMQRNPSRQNVQGHLQQFKGPSKPGGILTQNQNAVQRITQSRPFPGRVNSYKQIHIPIIWHVPYKNTNKGITGKFQRPAFSVSPMRPAALGGLGQTTYLKSISARNRTTGNPQRPYVSSLSLPYFSQEPSVQKQRAGMAQPFQVKNRVNSQPGGARSQQQQEKQTSLAYKMALFGQSNQIPQSNLPRPSKPAKQLLPPQPATNKQTNVPLMRQFNANYFPRPPYSLNAQQRVLPSSTGKHLKVLFPPLAQQLPQRIPQRQVSPFRPHYIYGHKSWPWNPWTNQASPIAASSTRSSAPLLPQAYTANPQMYKATAGFPPTLSVSPFAVPPKVLLYYYFYPRTITKPLMRLTDLKEDKLNGSFLAKLNDQISTAALKGNAGVAKLTENPTSIGQTNGKSTLTQAGQLPSDIAPYGAIKQREQIPTNTQPYRLYAGSSEAPLKLGPVAGKFVDQLKGKTTVEGPLRKIQLPLPIGTKQMTYAPLITPQSALTSPIVAQRIKPQTPFNVQLPVLAARKSQLTNGLLNRPIYIETVPYQLYNLLQQLPLFNAQSGTQRYLSRVISDILRLRYRKHKKKKRGAKESRIQTLKKMQG